MVEDKWNLSSWDLVDTSLNVDKAWNAFLTLENVIDRHVPLSTKIV